MKAKGIWATIFLLLLLIACGRGPDLDTRTFEVRYLDQDQVLFLLSPYVYSDRPNAPGQLSVGANAVTIRETGDNLEKIARVLEEYDKPKPDARLHFQIIKPNGRAASDPRIAEVEAALRELFRFEGYSLVGEAFLTASAGASSVQDIAGERGSYTLEAEVLEIRTSNGKGTIAINVNLNSAVMGVQFLTGVTVPIGQTVVLGSTSQRQPQGAIILTVRPELVAH